MANKTRKEISQPTEEEDKRLFQMLEALSPEQLTRLELKIAAIYVDCWDKASKTPEELMMRRDDVLARSSRFPPSDPFVAELKKKFHEKLMEKKVAPFKAIKGGRRRKRITPTLKGGFHL